MASIAPDRTHQPSIGPLRLILKLLRLSYLVLISIVLIPIAPLLGKQRAPTIVRWWYGRLLRVFNVNVRITGQAPDAPALIVTNHSTWLDVIVLGHVFDTVFVSKAEVGRWPIIGVYARVSGTLFLARGAYKTDDIRRQIQATFTHGRSVVLFPQGTTSLTPQPQRFHARLFSAAIDGKHMVLPVGIRYSDRQTPPGAHQPLVPWVDMPLLDNIKRVFCLPELAVEIAICPPIDSAEHDRRSLAKASREAINDCFVTSAQT